MEEEFQKINLEEQVLNYLRENKDGVTKDQLMNSMEANPSDVVEAINTLMSNYRVILKQVNEEIIFKYQSEKQANKFRDLLMEDMQIYEIILSAGANGITTNDLKNKTKLSTNLLNKYLKKLEKREVIKSLQMLNMKNKKIWLAFDIEPSTELTGGVWYSNQEFDKNLIEVISEKCVEYLSRQKVSTRKEIMIYIKSIGLIKNEIKEDDIQKILNILVFNDRIEVIFPNIAYSTSNKFTMLLKKNEPILGNLKYKISSDFTPRAVMDTVPCTFCPAFNECQIENIINPQDCPYMMDFLRLF